MQGLHASLEVFLFLVDLPRACGNELDRCLGDRLDQFENLLAVSRAVASSVQPTAIAARAWLRLQTPDRPGRLEVR